MRAAIIALMLMFGSQVGAESIEVGDVYFCNMTEFLEIDKSSDWKRKRNDLQNFKFQVTDNELVIRGKSYFKGSDISKDFHRGPLLKASDDYVRISLDAWQDPASFVYAGAYYGAGILITATCNKF